MKAQLVSYSAFFIILCLLNNKNLCMEENKKRVSTQKIPAAQQHSDDAYTAQALEYVLHRAKKEEAFFEMFAGDQFQNSPPSSSSKRSTSQSTPESYKSVEKS